MTRSNAGLVYVVNNFFQFLGLDRKKDDFTRMTRHPVSMTSEIPRRMSPTQTSASPQLAKRYPHW